MIIITATTSPTTKYGDMCIFVDDTLEKEVSPAPLEGIWILSLAIQNSSHTDFINVVVKKANTTHY